MTEISDMHDFLESFLGPETDAVETELSRLGHVELAAKLNRLSIDAGIDYMAMKTGTFDAHSGMEIARAAKDYQPVTRERLSLFNDIRTVLPGHQTVAHLCQALKQWPALSLSPAQENNPGDWKPQ